MNARHFMLLLLLALAMPAIAQEHAHSPYVGEQERTIASLSDQEITAYRTGRGMGLAKAAELNHYPGPRHVLDLAEELELTDAQRAEVRAAREAMRSKAIPLGKQIVAKEAALDALFADGQATPDTVRALLHEIAVLKADLRFAHLNAHLTMQDALTEQQIRRYDVLRGYASEAEHPGH